MNSKKDGKGQVYMSCIDVVCKKDGEWRWEVLFMFLGGERDGSECLAMSNGDVNT